MKSNHLSSEEQFEDWLEFGRERGWLEYACELQSREVAEDERTERSALTQSKSDQELSERSEKTRSGERTVCPIRSDQAIEFEIFHILSHHGDLDSTDIQIIVKDGHVTLRGFVDTKFEMHLSGELTERVPGVKSLTNQLKFKRFGFFTDKERESRHN